MFVKLLYSERGMGIIQVLAALLIVTASVSGLFISSYYARYKADAHYHYRVALLKAAQKLEEIKYYNMYNPHSVDLSIVPTSEFTISDKGEEDVVGYITKSKKSYRDLSVASFVAYDVVTIKITWENGPARYLYRVLNVPQELELREDYFYRTDDIVGGSE